MDIVKKNKFILLKIFLLIGVRDQKCLDTTVLANFSGEGILGPSARHEKVNCLRGLTL